MSDLGDIITTIGLCIMCFIGGCCAGSGITSSLKNDEAVKVGVAEYYLDADYNKQFRYNTNGAR